MSLFQYLNVNSSSLYKITTASVCVCVMLQLAAWYPLLSEIQHGMDRHLKRKERVESQWRKVQGQANRLKEAAFINTPWVSHRIESEKNAVPTQWVVDGVASVLEWQVLLEKAEEQAALALQSVHWQREPNGQWTGYLSFDIEAPRTNREYRNWLPTTLRSNHFVEKDWRILSTMRIDESASALLEYKHQRYWVRQGSWLPMAGLTVNSVSFDQVTLMSKDGSQMALMVRDKDGADD